MISTFNLYIVTLYLPNVKLGRYFRFRNDDFSFLKFIPLGWDNILLNFWYFYYMLPIFTECSLFKVKMLWFIFFLLIALILCLSEFINEIFEVISVFLALHREFHLLIKSIWRHVTESGSNYFMSNTMTFVTFLFGYTKNEEKAPFWISFGLLLR